MKKLITATLFALILLTNTTKAADEGIKVHGHWKFEIYNSDGSFDRKVEFENALSFGATTLLQILNKERSIGHWEIELVRACKNGNGVLVICIISEPGFGSSLPYDFENLTYGLDDNTNPTKLILNGSFTTALNLPMNTTIDFVKTRINTCNATSTPNCGSAGIAELREFTAKSVSIPVSSGQIIQVKVEISFS